MFFLATVAKQCDKCIGVIIQINNLYEKHLSIAAKLARSSSIVGIVNALYQYPVASGKQITDAAGTPQTSVNGYLSMLVENHILYTDNKRRNRTCYYYDLLDILRT